MNGFVGYIRRVCFIGSKLCNQGGSNPPQEEIINGVVNNGIQITNNSINVVHTGG